MRTVYLHGALANEFGSEFRMSITSPAEAFRALESYFPGEFFDRLRKGAYRVLRDEQDLGPELLHFPLGRSDLHVVPVLEGGKGGSGVGKIIMGAIIVVASIYMAGAAGAAMAAPEGGGAAAFGSAMGASAFSVAGFGVSYGSIAMMGVSMMLGGISSLLTPTPKLSSASYSNRESADSRPSALFNGPVNTVEQGGPVPLIYGRVMTGSTVASGSIVSEKM